MLPQTVQWIELDQVDSTNSWLITHLRNHHASSQPVSLLAHHQTAGRGRAGRSWLSSPAQSLTFSLAWPVAGALQGHYTLVVGVAVAQLLNNFCPSGRVELKWPNDLLVSGCKVGGVLCETVLRDAQTWLVVGVGLNLYGHPITSETLTLKGSLKPASVWTQAPLHSSMQRIELWRSLTLAVLSNLSNAAAHGFDSHQTAFNQLDAYRGQMVSVQNQGEVTLEGKACGCSDEGEYVLLTASGLVTVNVGDVSLRPTSEVPL